MPLPPSRRRYRRLAAPEEAQLVSLWEGGALSAEDLACRFGMSRRGIQAALTRLGAVKGRSADEAVIAATQRTLAALPPLPSDPAERIHNAREAAYRDAVRLQQLAMAAAEEAAQELGGVASIRVLAKVADVIAKARVVVWSSLNLDGKMPVNEGDLPELPVRDLTDEEVAAIRDQQSLDDEELGRTPPPPEPHEENEIVEEGGPLIGVGQAPMERVGGDDGPL